MSFKTLLIVNLSAVLGVVTYCAFSDTVHAEHVEMTSPVSPMTVSAAPAKSVLGKLQSVHTGRELDLRILGRGFFQVDLPDGRFAYTRDGAFRLSADGAIVTKDGFPLSSGIQVPENYLDIVVRTDGRVMVRTPQSITPVEIGGIELARFMNVDGLDGAPQRRGFFLETEESGPPRSGLPGEDGLGFVEQGSLGYVGDEWMKKLTNELFQLLSELELDVDAARPIQDDKGVNQLLIVVNL